jgi:serine/threonine protein kinase
MTKSVGTPLYADPNIQSGKYTKKCDVYSVGLVIVYIFCGRHYFSNCDTRDKLIEAKRRFCKNT